MTWGVSNNKPWSCIPRRIFHGMSSSICDRGRYHHDTDGIIYRCFLPDLTGFISVRHVSSTPSAGSIRGSAKARFS